jgi:hypothetical protein|tara:strand:- start:411 stop:1259 length:849 start_codon:yes stop_codon:yes gene_type:complete
MPLDFTAEELLPENLNFDVQFEPTKVSDKKYVINGVTGEYIGVVGDSFTCASHGAFFEGVHNTMTETLGEDECNGMNIRWKDARNNAWVMMDMLLPNVTSKVITDKHETTVSQRVIALHGIDGSCSNMVFFGAIDFFCTNGMIRGEHDKVRRKNTSNFSMDRFITDLQRSKQDFYAQSRRLQEWADTKLTGVDIKALLETILKSDRKAEKMYTLYRQEVVNRGNNVFSLYSAFTNYATYADERNGFQLRNTGNDTNAVSMFQRENQVSQWIETPAFKQLVAA